VVRTEPHGNPVGNEHISQPTCSGVVRAGVGEKYLTHGKVSRRASRKAIEPPSPR
jgi:hypothetical protein